MAIRSRLPDVQVANWKEVRVDKFTNITSAERGGCYTGRNFKADIGDRFHGS